eukprot:Gb_21973 [translate_table: standard]
MIVLNLSENLLQGFIPIELGELTQLEMLCLYENQLIGPIPDSLSNCSSLSELVLYQNELGGHIPPDWGPKLANIQELSLWGNQINGTIPNSIGNCSKLKFLYLSDNRLCGAVPIEIGNLLFLERLYLQRNQPPFFQSLHVELSQQSYRRKHTCQFRKQRILELVDVSYNRLAGTIPPEVAGLPNLVFYLSLSNDALQGSIPPEIGKLVMVQAIDISANKLIGLVPDTIGGMSELASLNLSLNTLRGQIPLAFGECKSLQYLNLSHNEFEGRIPGSFGNLRLLQDLDLSYNNMTGEVPEGGIFANLDSASFIGNPGFCGPRKYSLPPCPTLKRRRIHEGELVNASNGFSESNLLGIGSFGSVYKGILGDGVAAVKVLNLQNEAAHKSFVTECRFMSNGSLEKHLYPDDRHHGVEESSDIGDECELSLRKRVDIAIDIAHGMAYLHHHCFVQVVHCDLKPSNILLDDNMIAHVSDFGIAHLTFAGSADSITSTIALKGSVGYMAPGIEISLFYLISFSPSLQHWICLLRRCFN